MLLSFIRVFYVNCCKNVSHNLTIFNLPRLSDGYRKIFNEEETSVD